jgi:hypothetical protein
VLSFLPPLDNHFIDGCPFDLDIHRLSSVHIGTSSEIIRKRTAASPVMDPVDYLRSKSVIMPGNYYGIIRNGFHCTIDVAMKSIAINGKGYSENN